MPDMFLIYSKLCLHNAAYYHVNAYFCTVGT